MFKEAKDFGVFILVVLFLFFYALTHKGNLPPIE